MNGIENILDDFHLDASDKLVFTYFGSGNFLVLMFDDANFEKHMNANMNSSGNSNI